MKHLLLALCGLLTLNLRAAGPDTVRLQFEEAPVSDVLKYYEQLTGKQVVYDGSVRGQVSLETPNPVTREQAISLIEKGLSADGFEFVAALDGATVKVLARGKKTLAGEPLATFGFQLHYLDAGRALQAMADAQAPASTMRYEVTQAEYMPVKRTGYLLVTGPRSACHQLLKRLGELDVPTTPDKGQVDGGGPLSR